MGGVTLDTAELDTAKDEGTTSGSARTEFVICCPGRLGEDSAGRNGTGAGCCWAGLSEADDEVESCEADFFFTSVLIK